MPAPEDVNKTPEEPTADQGPQEDSEQQHNGLHRVPRRQAPLRPDLQLYEVRRGVKPGSRYVRITPSTQQPLRRMAPASRDERTS
jgi:hypothetical protein